MSRTPQPDPSRIAVQLKPEDLEILQFLRRETGIMSASELLRAALRAHRREVIRTTAVNPPPQSDG